jgi:Kyakuja-Dileera-Zisupton transposase
MAQSIVHLRYGHRQTWVTYTLTHVLALIKQLFDHIPSDMTVGLLYDIGCKLHRSCAKWEFLDEDILNRITFGIAVFHAFGHQWPCQVIYHPRKCKGFGLMDGEGCVAGAL